MFLIGKMTTSNCKDDELVINAIRYEDLNDLQRTQLQQNKGNILVN